MTAAAVTPGIRAACPSVRGRCRSSFSAASAERPGVPANPNPGGTGRSPDSRTRAMTSRSRRRKPSYRTSFTSRSHPSSSIPPRGSASRPSSHRLSAGGTSGRRSRPAAVVSSERETPNASSSSRVRRSGRTRAPSSAWRAPPCLASLSRTGPASSSERSPSLQRPRGQAGVGRVRTEQEPVLGSRGEEAVGLFGSEGHEVVDHHPDVGLVAPQRKRRLFPPPGGERRVHPRHEALARGLLVTRGSVHLSGEEEPGKSPRLERVDELLRKDDVVFHRVGRAEDLGPLQPRKGPDDFLLEIGRQRHRQAAQVGPLRLQPLWFDEDLVPLPLRESDHLVLYRGAVARTPSEDGAGVERRPVQVPADQVVRPFRGVRQPAVDLRKHRERLPAAPERERPRRHVARGPTRFRFDRRIFREHAAGSPSSSAPSAVRAREARRRAPCTALPPSARPPAGLPRRESGPRGRSRSSGPRHRRGSRSRPPAAGPRGARRRRETPRPPPPAAPGSAGSRAAAPSRPSTPPCRTGSGAPAPPVPARRSGP